MALRTKAVIRLSAASAAFAVLALWTRLADAQQLDERFTVWIQRAAPTPDVPASVLVRLGNAGVVIPAVALVAVLMPLWKRTCGVAALRLAGGLAIGSFFVLIPQHLLVHPGPERRFERPATGMAVALPHAIPPTSDHRRG